MEKIIVTADIEVHTKVDVSNFEIRGIFGMESTTSDIIDWIGNETDRAIDFVCKSLKVGEVVDNTLIGAYALKKNITLKPIEE